MKCLVAILLLNILILCVNLEHVWHSYQFDPNHRSREELIISNITSDDHFKQDFVVKKWKSLCLEQMCYLVGLMEEDVVITSVKLDESRKGFLQESYKMHLEHKPIDVALFEYWNSSAKNQDAMVVIAQKTQLSWYRIFESNFTLFSLWPTHKNISHINIFKIDYDYHILIVNQYLSETTADLYEFVPKDSQNFWLRQKFLLSELSPSSAVATAGPNYFLAISQPSLHLIQIYKFSTDHFLPFKNLTSKGLDDVISFNVAQKSFLAFNGFDAGIYRFKRNDLIKEKVVESHLEGVNYWLPIRSTVFGDNTVLVAQRWLHHGLHKSFVIEVFTYNGDKFEEHEDFPCFYFGEERLGSSCLPDEETEKGIQGSVAINLDGVLGILVPRKKRSSELFLVQTELMRIPNPLEKHIQEVVAQKHRLSELVKVQEERYNTLVERESIDYLDVQTQLGEMEADAKAMRQQLFEAGSRQYDTITFNGLVKVESSGSFDVVEVEKINNEPANDLLNDIVLKNKLKSIQGLKTFDNLTVDNLIVEKVNNVNASDFVFATNQIEITGDLFLTKPLTVVQNLSTSEVNGLVFQDEVINLELPVESLVFQNLDIGKASVEKMNSNELPSPDLNKFVFEEFFVPGNLEVGNINGENFNRFLEELCLRNIGYHIPGNVTVNGDVTVLEDAKVDYVNGLKFPGEYVFGSNSFPNITGTKTFLGTLSTSELNCDGTIDNIPPSRIITLTTPQVLPGTTTFKNLKITEGLNVAGNITGEHASKFLPNPTLLDVSFIKSKAHFKNLKVDGALVVSENFNGRNLEVLLSDVVYVNEEKAVIEAMKHFPQGFSVKKNLFITSKSINNISLDSIVTKNTDQILNLSTIRGVVDFGSVETRGLYDSVDVKKLDEDLVKLSGEQYISSTLIFEDEIDCHKLEVVESVKNLSTNVDKVRDLQNGVLEAQNIVVEGNMYGILNRFDLKDFEEKRMSFTQDQLIELPFKIDNLLVKNMVLGKLNNINPDELKRESWLRDLTRRVMLGNLSVTNFHGKSIEIDKISNNTVSNLKGSFWQHDIKKHNLTTLTFNNDVFFKSVQIEKLSGVNFTKFLNNIVFKNETTINLTSRKSFLKGLQVRKLIETKKLNDVKINNILTKYGEQEIVGPITIQGNVMFQNDVTIFENISGIPIDILTDSYRVQDDEFQINGDVLFNRVAHIRDLEIEGFVDDKRAREVIDGIVYKDENVEVGGLITFANGIKMEKNIRVNGKINNIDFPAFVSDIVLITKDTTIQSPVRFQHQVAVEDLVIHKNLRSNDLNGVDVKSWIDKALFIDRGNLKGDYLFEDVTVVDTLTTDFINDVNVQTLVLLREEQELPKMIFDEVTFFRDVDVGNSTNFCNLSQEFANSVLLNSDQDIESDVEFLGNVYIEGDMTLLGLLNNIDTDRIVTTNTDQNLSAIYNFKSKVSLEKNLTVDGLINGIDINRWLEDTVKTSFQYPQNITDNWEIDQDLVLEEDSLGNGLINEIDFRKFSKEVEEKRNHKYAIEKAFIDDYTNICKDLTYMHDKLKKQIYKFDYLENLQTLNFHEKVEYVYDYLFQQNVYLLINERRNCETYLFIFDSRFRYVKNIHFGHVAQIISIRDGDLQYLVVRNQPFYSACKVQGTNLWQTNDDGFVHLANVEDQELLQESLEPGTFYGLRDHIVTEFKVLSNLDTIIRRYRKWEVKEDNMAFVPRGIATGLALRTGKKIIKLHRDDPIIEDFNYETEEIIIGNCSEEFNTYLPGRKGSDLVVIKVGIKSSKRNLLAIASHEETSVKGSFDFIKIYEEVSSGKVFHKVPTYKPSSLVALNFNNGETLLAFMEDESVLQVYEYKGIEGFKHKLSAKLEGSKLFTMALRNERKIVGLVDKYKITFMEVVMLGNQIDANLRCVL